MSGIISQHKPGWVSAIVGGHTRSAIDRALESMRFGEASRELMTHRMYHNSLPRSITTERRSAASIKQAVAAPTGSITEAGADALVRGLRTRQDAIGEAVVTLPLAAASLCLIQEPTVALVGAGMCLMNLVCVAGALVRDRL